jgi:response regulator NasT
MLVDDNPRRAALVEACLRECGVDTLCLVPGQASLLRQIEQQAPDVIVIDLDSPGRDLLESLSVVSAHNPTPIVMFSGEEDPSFIAEAVDAGVTAYLVDGIKAEKVKPIIDAAMAQFRQFQRLRAELATTRSELGERKLIDQAKALMMKRYGKTEQECYACIRTEAMNRSLTTVDVARRIIGALSVGKSSVDKSSVGKSSIDRLSTGRSSPPGGPG